MNDLVSQIFVNALQRSIKFKVLLDRQGWIKAIKLGAVPNVFSGIAQAPWFQYIVSYNLHLTLSRFTLPSYHLEHGCLARSRNSKQCEALSILQTKGNSLHRLDLLLTALVIVDIALFGTINLDWHFCRAPSLHILFLIDDVFIHVFLVDRWGGCWHRPTQFPETAVNESDHDPPHDEGDQQSSNLRPGDSLIECVRFRVVARFAVVFVSWLHESKELLE